MMASYRNETRSSIQCKFFLRGYCRFGIICCNSHETPNPKSQECRFFLMGNCRFGVKCRYSHEQRDLNSVPPRSDGERRHLGVLQPNEFQQLVNLPKKGKRRRNDENTHSTTENQENTVDVEPRAKKQKTIDWNTKTQVNDFGRYSHRMEASFSNFCEKVFSYNSTYPILKTDPNMHVMVTDLVSFGDLEDASRITTEKIPVGGTIDGTIQTVRHFHPGVYKCTHAIPYRDWTPVYIYHHENIDPAKIIRQSFLMRDFNDYYGHIINNINKYDWAWWSVYGMKHPYDEDGDDYEDNEDDEDDEDEELLDKRKNNLKLLNERKHDMYFTTTENASCLKENVKNYCIVYSTIISSHYIVTSPQINSPIAMAVKVIPEMPRDEGAETFKFGKAFQDISSQKYFALMIYSNCGMLELDDYKPDEQGQSKFSGRYPHIKFTSVKETEFKFNMTDFTV